MTRTLPAAVGRLRSLARSARIGELTGGIRALLLLLSAFVFSARLGAAERPHIVVFISDDLGRLETSVYGSKDAKTPNLDRVASAGMTFESAYVASPSCCPNRYSLLTGLMPSRHGAHPNHSRVKPGTKFLPPFLKSLGYTIASFGKIAHRRSSFPGCDFNSPRPRDLSVNVRDWFRSKPEGPICLLVGDRRPHVLWTSESIYDPNAVRLPPDFIDTPETREHWARYLTEISGMDGEIGRILALASENLGKNFIFLFTSDHGGQWPRAKWNLYDSGTRIPLIVSWPGRIAAGVRTNAFVSWVDLVPTLLDLAGGEVPKEIDGRSFAAVLLGTATSHRERIFTTHTGDGVMNVFPMRSVRVANWKYILNLRPDAWHTTHSDRLRRDGSGAFWNSWDEAAKTDARAASIIRRYRTRAREELFDLSRDPFELTNLAADPKHRDRLASLRMALSSWTTAQGDSLEPHRDPYLRSKPIPDLRRERERSKREAGR